jgi:hypothetical protein
MLINNITETNESHVSTNESFKNLIDSMNFMSDKFNNFSKQVQKTNPIYERFEGGEQNIKRAKQ